VGLAIGQDLAELDRLEAEAAQGLESDLGVPQDQVGELWRRVDLDLQRRDGPGVPLLCEAPQEIEVGALLVADLDRVGELSRRGRLQIVD
jgi:hypothetical protein